MGTWHPTIVDHLYVLLFTVVYPAVGYWGWRRLLRQIDAGQAPDRAALFGATMLAHWLLLGLALAGWLITDRPWSLLGLDLSVSWGFVAAVVLGGIVIVAFGLQLSAIRRAPEERLREVEESLAPVRPILPRTRQELAAFYRLSVTAGVVEEILWRGLLITYLCAFVPAWVAGLLSAVGFGLAHAYQGLAQVPRAAALGAVFVILCFLSGSVWVAVVVHALVDVLLGRFAYEVLSRERSQSGEDLAVPGPDLP